MRACFNPRVVKSSSEEDNHEAIDHNWTGNARRRRDRRRRCQWIACAGEGTGAYAVVDISAITNPDLFKTLLPKAGSTNDAFGGKYVIRTENIVGVIGTPPKRFVVIAFDSMDKAKAWSASAAQQEVDAIAAKSLNSRRFLVDGTVQ